MEDDLAVGNFPRVSIFFSANKNQKHVGISPTRGDVQ